MNESPQMKHAWNIVSQMVSSLSLFCPQGSRVCFLRPAEADYERVQVTSSSPHTFITLSPRLHLVSHFSFCPLKYTMTLCQRGFGAVSLFDNRPCISLTLVPSQSEAGYFWLAAGGVHRSLLGNDVSGYPGKSLSSPSTRRSLPASNQCFTIMMYQLIAFHGGGAFGR